MTPEVWAFVESLLLRIESLGQQLAEARKPPDNSSAPPSTQHPHAKTPKSSRSKSKRKRGGQKGHKRHTRTLVPAEQCSEVIVLHPDNCRRCGRPLDGDDPEPIRHQVWELPKIEPLITEYQRHRLS
ncbi:MAG: IS66 family transposase, partial [Planctomycetaceae bacterium]|nr:IS66 family transposase [Planctomycetaceae bacterium]